MTGKTTHTLEDIEERWHKQIAIIKDPDSTVIQKKNALKKAGFYEDFMRTVNYKHINGKTYAVRKIPKDISKKELLALIDSVDISDTHSENILQTFDKYTLDLSGVSPGSNRFSYRE